jgi:hypothetical protein
MKQVINELGFLKHFIKPLQAKNTDIMIDRIEALRIKYEEALEEGNLEKAAYTGEKYYTALRGGYMFTADKEALERDLQHITGMAV